MPPRLRCRRCRPPSSTRWPSSTTNGSGRRSIPAGERRAYPILIVGSGYLTHGLPFLERETFAYNKVPGWSAEFDACAEEQLADGAIDRLADFHRAPGMPYAHPTVEHDTPIFVTLGAAIDPTSLTTVIDDFQMGLAKHSFQVA